MLFLMRARSNKQVYLLILFTPGAHAPKGTVQGNTPFNTELLQRVLD